MITSRLKLIFGLSIPLFIAHGIEEFTTHFYNTDAWDQAIFGNLFINLSTHGATFVTFQIMLWLLLIVAFLLLLGEHWRFYMLALLGIIFVYELHHPIKALLAGGYYPGLITSLVFPILAFLFWREWLRIFQSSSLKK